MMLSSLTIADNFAKNPLVIRREALALNYQAKVHAGHRYHGIGLGYDPDLAKLVAEAMGFKIKMRMAFFRLGMTGIPMSGFIHADQVESCGEYAGVLYLNLPHQKFGGTAFWKHNETGFCVCPKSLTVDDAQAFADDGLDESKWTQELFVPMKFNRFIAYRSQLFHSRYPNTVEADTAEEGRLVWVCFFDRAD